MNFKQQKAIYMQIADYILENILAGKIAQGERIPSVREMAASIEVNPNTIVRTYNYLQDRDIIYNQRGVGYFVADDGLEKTKALKRQSFVRKDLPQLFRMMDLLKIDFNELKNFYENGNSHFSTKNDEE